METAHTNAGLDQRGNGEEGEQLWDMFAHKIEKKEKIISDKECIQGPPK